MLPDPAQIHRLVSFRINAMTLLYKTEWKLAMDTGLVIKLLSYLTNGPNPSHKKGKIKHQL